MQEYRLKIRKYTISDLERNYKIRITGAALQFIAGFLLMHIESIFDTVLILNVFLVLTCVLSGIFSIIAKRKKDLDEETDLRIEKDGICFYQNNIPELEFPYCGIDVKYKKIFLKK